MWEAAEERGESVGERGSGLDGGTFAAGGASAEVGEGGAEEDEGRHAGGDGARGVGGLGVDLLEDEVVASFDGAAEVVVEQAHGETGEGEEEQEPRDETRGCGWPSPG